MDIHNALTEKEQAFLKAAARRKNIFLAASASTVIVAVSFFVYHAFFAGDLSRPGCVITLLLLLSGRSYLRLYRSAVIFRKIV